MERIKLDLELLREKPYRLLPNGLRGIVCTIPKQVCNSMAVGVGSDVYLYRDMKGNLLIRKHKIKE